MAVKVDKRTFEKGMNLDLDNHVLGSGMYKYALNIHNSPSGNLGIITTAKGNELVEFDISEGSRVIGSIDYEKGSVNFYFIWDSKGFNKILMYDYTKNIIDTVFQDSPADPYLNFPDNTIITGIGVVQFKTDTLIYWTDNGGEPKKVSVKAGLNFYGNNSKFKGYAPGISIINKGDAIEHSKTSLPFPWRDLYYVSTINNNTNQPWIDINDARPNTGWELMDPSYMYPIQNRLVSVLQLAQPSTIAPTVSFVNNRELKVNKLRGAFWQFAYKYIYADGQESAWSPISKTPFPISQAPPYQRGIEDEVWRDNELKIIAEVPNNYYIQSVKLAVRRVYNSDFPEDFQLFKEVFLSDLSQDWTGINHDGIGLSPDRVGIVVTFNGNEELLPISIEDMGQLFYWVPRFAKTLAISGDNRMIFANGTWGYDVDPNLISGDGPELTASYKIYTPPLQTALTVAGWPDPDGNPDVPNATISVTIDQQPSVGDRYRIDIDWESDIDVSNNGSYSTNPRKMEDGFTIDYGVSKAVLESFPTTSLTYWADVRALIASDIAEEINNKDAASYRYVYVTENSAQGGSGRTQVSKSLLTASTNGAVIDISVENFPLNDFNNKSGDPVSSTIVPVFKTYDGMFTAASVNAIRSFKRGSTQTYGLVYSDHLGRVSTVITDETLQLYIKWYLDNVYTENGSVSMSMRLFHLAPEWATRCHIVKKTINGVRNFVQIPLSRANLNEETTLNNEVWFSLGLVDETDGITVIDNPPGSPVTVNIYLNALNGSGDTAYNNIVEASILSYSYARGDRFRVIHRTLDAAGDPVQEFVGENDVEILGYNEKYNYITLNRDSLILELRTLFDETNAGLPLSDSGHSPGGLLFEIYTPDADSDLTGFYYETGISLEVIDGNHVGTDGIPQDFDNNVPANVALDCGDVYYKNRIYAINGRDIPAGFWAADNQQSYSYLLEEYNYSDVFDSRVFDVGRFNVRTQVDPIEGSQDHSGQSRSSYKPATMYYSEPYIQGTDVNRLGSVYDISFKDATDAFNSIQHIHSDSDSLLIFQEDRVGIAYNGRYVQSDLRSKKTLSSGATAPAISDIQYVDYQGGISLNPESFAVFEEKKFFFDLRRGSVCTYENGRVMNISLGSVDEYIKDISDKMLYGTEVDIAIGAFDRRYKEYLLNLKWSDIAIGFLQAGFAGAGYEYKFVLPDGFYTSQFVVGETILFTFYPTVTVDPSIILPQEARVEGTVSKVYDQTIELMNVSESDHNHLYQTPAYKSEIIAYNDLVEAWTGFFDYIPDFMSSAGLEMVSWKSAQLYIHGSDNVPYGQFYGEDKEFVLTAVSNMDSTNTKDWMTVGVVSNDQYNALDEYDWSVVDDGILTSEDQVSYLQNSDFTYLEGTMYSPFLMNKKTPNFGGDEIEALLEGEPLKGKWISAALKIDSGITSPKEIVAVNFRFAASYFAQ